MKCGALRKQIDNLHGRRDEKQYEFTSQLDNKTERRNNQSQSDDFFTDQTLKVIDHRHSQHNT